MRRVELYREILAGRSNVTRVFGYDVAAELAATHDGTRLGKWRWRFIKNGHIMADSGQGYSRRTDCLHGAVVSNHGRLFRMSNGETYIRTIDEDASKEPGTQPAYQSIPVVDLTKAKP